jgi:H+/Cl- antiporter ClcA
MKNNTSNTLSYWYSFRSKIIAQSVLVGLISGLVVVFYRFLLEKAIHIAHISYKFQLNNYWFIPIWIIILIITGYIVGSIIQNEPMSSGSGIPQVEGIILRKLNMNWLKIILGKFIGGVLCIGAGLSLGREGPSIQIGASVGQGFSAIFKRVKLEEKFLITSGASAGLAAAFNAPISGAIFAMEEVHKNFSPIVLGSALTASITADFVSKQFFGLKPVFNFNYIKPIPLNDYSYLIFLGIILGILGVVFNKSLLKTQDMYNNQKLLSVKTRPIFAFIIAGIFGLLLPEVLGGGHSIVESLVDSSFNIKFLLIILLAKFIFTMISYGSGSPGGIFLPLLVIGALIGAIYGYFVIDVFGFDKSYINNLIILGMAGYFTAIVKAPITGIILITEMTGSFSHILPICIVSMIAYIVSDIMKSKPIYESLLERMIDKGMNRFKGENDTKVIIEIAVCMGSALEEKKVKEIEWPLECLIVGIKRGNDEIIPNGDTTIYAGDYLIVLANEDCAGDIRECLSDYGEKCILT